MHEYMNNGTPGLMNNAQEEQLVITDTCKHIFSSWVPVNVLESESVNANPVDGGSLTPTTEVWPLKIVVGSRVLRALVYEFTSHKQTVISSDAPRICPAFTGFHASPNLHSSTLQ